MDKAERIWYDEKVVNSRVCEKIFFGLLSENPDKTMQISP